MDEKKFDKAIDALLQLQAGTSADLDKLKESQKEAEKRVNVLERVSLNLYNASVEQGKNIAEVTKSIKEQRVAQKETDERMKETDERLNAVIFMAEKFFGGNGKAKPKAKPKR